MGGGAGPVPGPSKRHPALFDFTPSIVTRYPVFSPFNTRLPAALLKCCSPVPAHKGSLQPAQPTELPIYFVAPPPHFLIGAPDLEEESFGSLLFLRVLDFRCLQMKGALVPLQSEGKCVKRLPILQSAVCAITFRDPAARIEDLNLLDVCATALEGHSSCYFGKKAAQQEEGEPTIVSAFSSRK